MYGKEEKEPLKERRPLRVQVQACVHGCRRAEGRTDATCFSSLTTRLIDKYHPLPPHKSPTRTTRTVAPRSSSFATPSPETTCCMPRYVHPCVLRYPSLPPSPCPSLPLILSSLQSSTLHFSLHQVGTKYNFDPKYLKEMEKEVGTTLCLLPSFPPSSPPLSLLLQVAALQSEDADLRSDKSFAQAEHLGEQIYSFPPSLLTPSLPPSPIILQVAALRSEDADLSEKGFAQAKHLGEKLDSFPPSLRPSSPTPSLPPFLHPFFSRSRPSAVKTLI